MRRNHKSVSVRRRWRQGVCAAACALALLVPASAAAFSDVPGDAWYAAAVSETVDAGLLSGVGGGAFDPDGTVTRAMTVTALWRLAGQPAAAAGNHFSDVAEGTWYTDAVNWAAECGVAAGDGKGNFSPEMPVTREQLAVLLYQYARHQGLDTAQGKLDAYTDGKTVSKWAVDGMEHAVGAGIISGSGGKLRPGDRADRAELAVMLERLMTPAVG